jgi:hypothetical protein
MGESEGNIVALPHLDVSPDLAAGDALVRRDDHDEIALSQPSTLGTVHSFAA